MLDLWLEILNVLVHMSQCEVRHQRPILLVHLREVTVLDVLRLSLLHLVKEQIVDFHVLVIVELVLRFVLLLVAKVKSLHDGLPSILSLSLSGLY